MFFETCRPAGRWCIDSGLKSRRGSSCQPQRELLIQRSGTRYVLEGSPAVHREFRKRHFVVTVCDCNTPYTQRIVSYFKNTFSLYSSLIIYKNFEKVDAARGGATALRRRLRLENGWYTPNNGRRGRVISLIWGD